MSYFQSLSLLHNIESNLSLAWELLADLDYSAYPLFLKSSKLIEVELRWILILKIILFKEMLR